MYRLTVVIATILIVAQATTPVFAQYECPPSYTAQNRTYNLATHDIRTDGAFKVIKCKYGSLQASGPEFEVKWSSTGQLHDKKWCTDQLEEEYGHILFSSSERYVTITAQRVQLGTEDIAKGFVNKLYDMVKTDARSCSSQPTMEITEPQKDGKDTAGNEIAAKEITNQQNSTQSHNTSNQEPSLNLNKNMLVLIGEELFEDPYFAILGTIVSLAAVAVLKVRQRKGENETSV